MGADRTDQSRGENRDEVHEVKFVCDDCGREVREEDPVEWNVCYDCAELCGYTTEHPNEGVYFLYSETTKLVKIGTSKNIRKRIREVSLASGLDVELLQVVPGGYKEEAEQHQRYRRLRAGGEWFRCEGELADAMGRL